MLRLLINTVLYFVPTNPLYRPVLYALGALLVAVLGAFLRGWDQESGTSASAVATVTGAYHTAADTTTSHWNKSIDGAEAVYADAKAHPSTWVLGGGSLLLGAWGLRRRRPVVIEAAPLPPTTSGDVTDVFEESPDLTSPGLRRAELGVVRNQLTFDEIDAQNKLRTLEGHIKNAEQGHCRTQDALANARRNLDEKERQHSEAAAQVAALHSERVRTQTRLAQTREALTRVRDELSVVA